MNSLFAYRTPLKEFEDAYGIYRELKRLPLGDGMQMPDAAIYMARSHMDRDKSLADKALYDWIKPVQAGAALTDVSIYDRKDSTGDNISEKNGNYSEATAIYWMYKNAPACEYIGLNHYRRHIDIDERDWRRIKSNDIDVITTRPTFVPQGNGTFFETLVPKCDVKFFRDAIDRVMPEYAEARDEYMTARFYPPCNVYAMKYELFLDYAAYVFAVTFEVERIYAQMGFIRRDRYMGYLVEALLGIYLIKHKDELATAYTDMIFFE